MTNLDAITEKYKLTFSPRTITDALGSKIIELDAIVFSELIKNSRDAHSKNITINFENYKNTVSIEDNGNGMTSIYIKNNWGVVASDNKANDFSKLGGKGIGRFSVFKLCSKITIITKTEDSEELEFSINTAELLNLKSAENFEIKVTTNKMAKIFTTTNSKGTKIILENMNLISLDEIFSDLQNLILENSPTKQNLNINFIYPKDYVIQPIISTSDAKLLAPFKCTAYFNGNNLISYSFTAELNNVQVAFISESQKLSESFSKLDSNISLGKVYLQLNQFFLGNEFISHYGIDKNKLQTEFLDHFNGVSVYREDFKIFGLGNMDWLGLSERRIDKPTKHVNNKQIYSFVKLNSLDSNLLEEKTSREGFIRSKYLTYLKNAIMLIIKQFEDDALSYRKQLNKNPQLFESNINAEPLQWSSQISDNQKLTSHNTQDPSQIDDNQNLISQHTQEPNHVDDNQNLVSQLIQEPNHVDDNQNLVSQLTQGHYQANDSQNLGSQQSQESSQGLFKSYPKRSFNTSVIIDASFIVPDYAPEKIKKITYELQTVKSANTYSQALLLRCLLDITTNHGSKTLGIEFKEGDLKGSINKVLQHLGSNKLLNQKYIDRIRVAMNKDNIINYFNGIVHYPDYRTNYDAVKDIWDTFEPYIKYCIEKKMDES
ncbi:hypothetical protein psyc5s11_22190 [Clostridium gelidum]|uniref:ATP-binding protein n=1 Tax=Clostridium gelidum TaxID=704125 RepID=A0ABM7T4F1_9CLOT|nr:ATP-binding protein [Clostridium gelidum]BCZ46152.1 hypothetical protein psyc5s11_22190 [Clostridium gelidum]